MPRFQGSLDTVFASRDWARATRKTIFAPNVQAIEKAYTDAGKPVPEDYRMRLGGGRDEDQKK
jgi:limonene 1,2-monooxygenase